MEKRNRQRGCSSSDKGCDYSSTEMGSFDDSVRHKRQTNFFQGLFWEGMTCLFPNVSFQSSVIVRLVPKKARDIPEVPVKLGKAHEGHMAIPPPNTQFSSKSTRR